MPNHVTNELRANESVVKDLCGPEGNVDFNRIVPMPELLQGDSAMPLIEDWARFSLGLMTVQDLQPTGIDAAEAFKDGDYGAASAVLKRQNMIQRLQEGPYIKDMEPDRFELFLKYLRALYEYGHANWYSWSVENWGTKWNAYRTEHIEPGLVRFETAWSAPIPVIDALSRNHADAEIRLRWADEDFGCNVGDVTVRNAEIVAGGALENGSREAEELALKLVHGGELPEHMRRNDDGRIVYVED